MLLAAVGARLEVGGAHIALVQRSTAVILEGVEATARGIFISHWIDIFTQLYFDFNNNNISVIQ